MVDPLEMVRARAAARARAVRVADSTTADRSLIETDYMTWLRAIFPEQMSGYRELADFHHELLAHAWAIQKGVRPLPFFAIWFRGAGKSTLGEMIAVMLGALERRRYVLYVCATQDQANDHVNNIRSLIENSQIAYYYPEMAEPARSKRTNAMLRWSAEQIQCGNGFTVTGIGLEAAIRGARVNNFRPDLIHLDDVDEKTDSLAMVDKKIGLLTSSIVAAGSNDRAIMGLQNLIHRDSIFSRILDGRGKLFPNRIISGPVQMVKGAKVETRDSVDMIVRGQPCWPAMSMTECQGWLEDLTLRSWLTECQHEVDIPYEDATFKEFDPVYHCITVSEFMRYYVGNKAFTYDLQWLDAPFNDEGYTARLTLPRGSCAMATDWRFTKRSRCANRWLWRPGERVPLSDSVFFIREMVWPTFPDIEPDPRDKPTPGRVHAEIVKIEQELGIEWRRDFGRKCLEISLRLFSHERPEGAEAFRQDHGELSEKFPLNYWSIDTRKAKEGIMHLQDFLSIDYSYYHPFRIDPRTLPKEGENAPLLKCPICKWEHYGQHLRGRPRAFYIVADGQGELYIDALGKLKAKPAINEAGQYRTRFEYPRHKPRQSAEGEEKQAAKRDDDVIDTDRALMGYVYHMIERLSPEEAFQLRWKEKLEQLQTASYPDKHARVAAEMSARYFEEEERLEAERHKIGHWTEELEGWDQC